MATRDDEAKNWPKDWTAEQIKASYVLTAAPDRLIAENERLKGREKIVAPLLRLVLSTTHMGDEWEREAEAWLAGYKP